MVVIAEAGDVQKHQLLETSLSLKRMEPSAVAFILNKVAISRGADLIGKIFQQPIMSQRTVIGRLASRWVGA
jgi:hypothetical protein